MQTLTDNWIKLICNLYMFALAANFTDDLIYSRCARHGIQVNQPLLSSVLCSLQSAANAGCSPATLLPMILSGKPIYSLYL